MKSHTFKVVPCRGILKPCLYAEGTFIGNQSGGKTVLTRQSIEYDIPEGWVYSDMLVFDIGDENASTGRKNELAKEQIMTAYADKNMAQMKTLWDAANTPNGPGAKYKSIFYVYQDPVTFQTTVLDEGGRQLDTAQRAKILKNRSTPKKKIQDSDRVIFMYAFILRFEKDTEVALIDPGIGNEYK